MRTPAPPLIFLTGSLSYPMVVCRLVYSVWLALLPSSTFGLNSLQMKVQPSPSGVRHSSQRDYHPVGPRIHESPILSFALCRFRCDLGKRQLSRRGRRSMRWCPGNHQL